MSRRLKPSHKNLRLIEGSFIYCRRHELENNFELFMDNHFMQEGFDADKEFEKILTDIRCKYLNMTPKQQAQDFWTEYRAMLSLPGAPLGEMKDAIAKSLTINKCHTIINTINESMLYKETKRKFWADVLIEAESLKA